MGQTEIEFASGDAGLAICLVWFGVRSWFSHCAVCLEAVDFVVVSRFTGNLAVFTDDSCAAVLTTES